MPGSDAGAAKTILLKRAYAPPEAADGVRVLVDRLWPRGVSKEAAKLDAWMAPLGPSDELRKWFGHRPDRWTAFTEKYRAELESPLRRTLLATLQDAAGQSTLTLVYGARDTRENEAIVVRQRLLHDELKPAADWDASTKLLAVMAVVAAAHHDAAAPASAVDLFAASLLTAREMADATAELVGDGLLRVAPGGWTVTERGKKEEQRLAAQHAPPDDPPGEGRARHAVTLRTALEALVEVPPPLAALQRRASQADADSPLNRLGNGCGALQRDGLQAGAAHRERVRDHLRALEALRPEPGLAPVHDAAVDALRVEAPRLAALAALVDAEATGDAAQIHQAIEACRAAQSVAQRAQARLGDALRATKRNQPDLFARLDLPRRVLDALGLAEAARQAPDEPVRTRPG